MFRGEYNHTIDEKGRLIIPSRFRYELGESFVLTRGLDGCICIYPQTEWDQLEEKLRELPLTSKSSRQVIRFLIGGAVNCELDRQGRILIPAPLRAHAGLTKEAVLVGTLERIEIWDKTRYEGTCSFDDVESIAEDLTELGLMI